MEKSFEVIVWAPGYDIEICRAYRPGPEDLTQYAEWYRPLVFHVLGNCLRLPNLRVGDMPRRPSDGSFPGYCNHAWIINESEVANFIRLNRARQSAL